MKKLTNIIYDYNINNFYFCNVNDTINIIKIIVMIDSKLNIKDDKVIKLG